MFKKLYMAVMDVLHFVVVVGLLVFVLSLLGGCSLLSTTDVELVQEMKHNGCSLQSFSRNTKRGTVDIKCH